MSGTTFTKSVSNNLGVQTATPTREADAFRLFTQNLGLNNPTLGVGIVRPLLAIIDNLGMTEALVVGTNKLLQTSNLGFNDPVLKALGQYFFFFGGDALGVQDSVSTFVPKHVNASDNLGQTDSLAARLASAFRIFADNFGLQDSTLRLANAFRVFSQNLGITDSVLAGVHLKSTSLTDNLGVQDTVASVRVPAWNRLASDNLGIQDTANARVPTWKRKVTDNLGLSDSVSVVQVIGVGRAGAKYWFAEDRPDRYLPPQPFPPDRYKPRPVSEIAQIMVYGRTAYRYGRLPKEPPRKRSVKVLVSFKALEACASKFRPCKRWESKSKEQVKSFESSRATLLPWEREQWKRIKIAIRNESMPVLDAIHLQFGTIEEKRNMVEEEWICGRISDEEMLGLENLLHEPF